MPHRPISVLLFTNTNVRAGVEEHMLTLLRGLDRRAFRPFLACPPELLDQFGSDIPSDVPTLPVTLDHPSHFRAARALSAFLRSHQIDILHCHMFQSTLYGAPVGRLAGVPAVVETCHGTEGWRKGWIKSGFFVDRQISRFVNAHLAVSDATASYLTTRKRLPARKVVAIPNGCDLSSFDPLRPKPDALLAQLDLSPDRPILVTVARLEPQKGHCVLLDALPTVLAGFPSAMLVCVGDGALRPSLEQQARRLGIADSVRFVGYQRNAPDWLALADVVVLPSWYEGLPLVAVEALAAGRAFVGTAVDGTSEVVVHQQTGLTVPPGDSPALAGAILRLLGDDALRGRLARQGRRRVELHFSADRQLRQTEDLYRQCLGLPLPSPPASSASDPDLSSGSHESAITETIRLRTAAHCSAVLSPGLRSVILTGSLARGEATICQSSAGWDISGDAEFLLVFHDSGSLPARDVIVRTERAIHEALLRDGISCHVGLGLMRLRHLLRMEPHIFRHELRTWGRVIWGDASDLLRLPVLPASGIPLEDGWRMLSNRMIESLPGLAEASAASTPLSPATRYCMIKLCLDTATSLLLFAGSYRPSYRAREAALRNLAAVSPDRSWPFDLASFSLDLSLCTSAKLDGGAAFHMPVSLARRIARRALQLWLWELAHLTSSSPESPLYELWNRWASAQPLSSRLRGWARLFLRGGWTNAASNWPRWYEKRSGSPRYWVYLAAAKLFAAAGPDSLPVGRDVARILPLARLKSAASANPWRDAADAVLWHYNEFMVDSRV